MQFVKGDIQSADLVRHIFDQEKIDTVMHFAAQVSVKSMQFCVAVLLCMKSLAACRLMWTTPLATVWRSQ